MSGYNGGIAIESDPLSLKSANNLSDVADAATSRTSLGLGSAATLTAGTGANNVVQLDGAGALPAVDGSALTGLSGVTVQTATVNTASIAASGSEDNNVVGLPSDNILIVGCSVTLTAGASTSVSVLTYGEDTFTTEMVPCIGSAFSGSTPPALGPRIVGGSTFNLAGPYYDLDGTQELHVRVVNQDGVNAGTFQVKIKYINLGAF